jgi:hypothetical protein
MSISLRSPARTTVFALAWGAAAGAVACSNATVPLSTHACAGIAIPYEQLLYPIPNATGVPTAAASLVFNGGLDDGFLVVLTPASGAALALGTFVAAPSPLPSPMATPQAAGGTLVSTPYTQLASATTYTVSYRLPESGACGDDSQTAGRFTTQ